MINLDLSTEGKMWEFRYTEEMRAKNREIDQLRNHVKNLKVNLAQLHQEISQAHAEKQDLNDRLTERCRAYDALEKEKQDLFYSNGHLRDQSIRLKQTLDQIREQYVPEDCPDFEGFRSVSAAAEVALRQSWKEDEMLVYLEQLNVEAGKSPVHESLELLLHREILLFRDYVF